MNDTYVTIRGRRWRLLFTNRIHKDRDGDCSSPDEPHRTIRIRKTLRGERLLEVLLHEIEHAAHWTEAEESVVQIAEEKARILTRLGYKVCQCKTPKRPSKTRSRRPR